MEGPVKAKVTARLPVGGARSRPGSPTKLQPTVPSVSAVRPRAKVTSTANIHMRKTNSAPANVAASTSSKPMAGPPRAPSPFKAAQGRSSQDASTPGAGTSQVKARLTARANGSRSASPQPELRQRALTAAPQDLSAGARQRRGSASSSLHAKSPSHSGLSVPSSPSKSILSSADENSSTVGSTAGSTVNGVIRVRSKVSRVTELGQGQSSAASLSPPSSLPRSRPARVPSISSLSPLSPLAISDGPLSPPVSAPSGHTRFATTRESPTQRSHPFQPFSDDHAVRYPAPSGRGGSAAQFEPQSPPTSTLSFSSRSSASHSSASYETQNTDVSRSTAPTLNPRLNANPRIRAALTRTNMDSPSSHIDRAPSEPTSPTSPSDDHYDDDRDEEEDADGHATEDVPEDMDPDRKLKAEAKSNRKIADLEITNRSLLAINSSLEAMKHKQAKEIRDLKRKLRESRLVLPPPAFRAVQEDMPDEDEEDADDSDDGDDAALLEGTDDEPFRRVRIMLETLLDSCRIALATKPADFAGGAATKVLSAEEVRNWRGEDPDAETRSSPDADADSRPLTPSRVAVPDSDGGLESEDEVEASLLEPDVASAVSLPPITVTPSP